MLECLESLPIVNIFINSLEFSYLFGSYSHLLLDSYLPDPPTLLSTFVSIFLKPSNTNLYYLIFWVYDLHLDCSQLSRRYPLRETAWPSTGARVVPWLRMGLNSTPISMLRFVWLGVFQVQCALAQLCEPMRSAVCRRFSSSVIASHLWLLTLLPAPLLQ